MAEIFAFVFSMTPQDSTGSPSILLIGTGVFGLSTLKELLNRPQYAASKITIVSPSIPASLAPVRTSHNTSTEAVTPRIASNDINRIIRMDYADAAYASLMEDARTGWLQIPGLSRHYHESGLLLTAGNDTRGASYIKSSLENMKVRNRSIKEFRGENDVAEALHSSKLARATGTWGYINEQSGWADAGSSLGWLWDKVAVLSKSRDVHFVRSSVERLSLAKGQRRVSGAILDDGKLVSADLTILATGAWTPALLDITGIASARAQSLLYVDVSDEEAQGLKDNPVHFNLSRGCILFPPTKKPEGGWQVKLARHAFGYSNPQPSINGASLPAFPERLPAVDQEILVNFLKDCLPSADIDNRQLRARICWYLDTTTSDFLVCFHPEFDSLFVATGGSGHAFKFLPVLGTKVVEVLDGKDSRECAGFWTKKWAWPAKRRDTGGNIVSEIWCHDGTRAGEPGLTLEQALAGGQGAVERVRSKM